MKDGFARHDDVDVDVGSTSVAVFVVMKKRNFSGGKFKAAKDVKQNFFAL